MLSWVIPNTINTPTELINAERHMPRRIIIDRYRSRTDVTNDHIFSAYAWYKLPIVHEETIGDVNQNRIRFRTKAIPRGIPEDEALAILTGIVQRHVELEDSLNILMFNSGTAAAATENLKNWLSNNPDWEQLNITTMVTTTPNHKVFMYKYTARNLKDCYVIINNIDTPTVTFKLAAAIMLNLNYFGEDTERFAQAWLSGNGDEICTTVTNYYAAVKTKIETAQRKDAVERMCRAMTADKTSLFKRRIDAIQAEIDDFFREISVRTQELEKAKSEYLLYTLEDDDSKSNEFKKFIESCGNKIVYIKFVDNRLYLVYRTSLIYYEPDILKRYFESTRPNCVTHASEACKQLLKDIFIEAKYELLIESGAVLNITTNAIEYASPINLRSCTDQELIGIPNPHHAYYNCWGDNKPNIVKALMDKDYITALLTTFAAMSGLNIADTAVLEKFITNEVNNFRYTPCLKDKTTNEIITIDQYIRRWEDAHDESN